jgi:ABC-type antimicrobial peptide transport system permease subunit
VRPALFGAVADVLGILAAFTFSSGVSDASTHLDRFGQTWQLETFTGVNDTDFLPSEQVFQELARDQDVAGVNDARLGVAHAGTGSTTVTRCSRTPVGQPLRVVLTDGRLPTAADEVVLAPSSATALHARIGSQVRLEASREARQLTVVGLGFVPQSPHNDYDNGGLVTAAGFDSLFSGFKFHVAQITLRPGADVDEVQPRLARRISTLLDGAEFPLDRPQAPGAITELRTVRVLPVALGAFLVLLALGAVGHALATAVRRRRHDVAVLRALGMTRWQSRGIVVTQASVLAVVGLAFGVPLGIALGRTVWRFVADYTPVYYVPPLALWALLLVGPLALLVANLLAAWPGHVAARLHLSHVLRAE